MEHLNLDCLLSTRVMVKSCFQEDYSNNNKRKEIVIMKENTEEIVRMIIVIGVTMVTEL